MSLKVFSTPIEANVKTRSPSIMGCLKSRMAVTASRMRFCADCVSLWRAKTWGAVEAVGDGCH